METSVFKTKSKLCLICFAIFVVAFTLAMWVSVTFIPYGLGIFAVLGLVVTFFVSLFAKSKAALIANLATNALLTGFSVGALFLILEVPYVFVENICFAGASILVLVVHLFFLRNKQNPSTVAVTVFVVLTAILVGFCVSEPSELTIYLSVYFVLYAVFVSGFVLNSSGEKFVHTMELCSFTILMLAFVAVTVVLFGKDFDPPTVSGVLKDSSKQKKED